MTDQQHPITPPQWQVDAWCKQALAMGADVDAVFLEAARWGADQELEACCKLLKDSNWDEIREEADDLRAARRPNPPSLKEKALQELDKIEGFWDTSDFELESIDTIRRALEQLDD